jgi:hypothetical protein
MFEKEEKDKQFGKLLESISDDLFIIKLELKLLRIDELLGRYGNIFGGDECEVNLKTYFQRIYFCRNWLKRHIFWAGDDPEGIKKVIDQLFNNFRVCEGIERNYLIKFAEDMVKERSREIDVFKKWILDQKSTSEYEKIAMDEFKREQNCLSRIEALYRLNRIQWRCEVLEQMERYFRVNNNIDGWKYEMPLVWGIEDERTVLDF